MGLIRDVISSMGPGDINNGCSNRYKLPFGQSSTVGNNAGYSSSLPQASPYRHPPFRQNDIDRFDGYHDCRDRSESWYPSRRNDDAERCGFLGVNGDDLSDSQRTQRCHGHDDLRYDDDYEKGRMPRNARGPRFGGRAIEANCTGDGSFQQPPPYTAYSNQEPRFVQQGNYPRPTGYYPETAQRGYATNASGSARFGGFRPLALPQIAYGDGEPFLRGYSNELWQYNISMDDFMQVLDQINVTIIPNPEQQLFQKAASIAGFFVPGAGGIGLMVGQIAVGVGAGVGKASHLSTVLANANIRLFIPNGLEIGIGKTANVDTEAGVYRGGMAPGGGGPQMNMANMLPEERIACYGDHLAPLTAVLPPLQQNGRHDPIAMLGKAMANRDQQKKLNKAQRKMDRGKSEKMDSIEGHLKWIVIRRATPQAIEFWNESQLRRPTTSDV